MTWLRRWGWLLLAPLVTLLLYRQSFVVWFARDDFAWLGIGLSITDLPSLLDALFGPKAQGTIRPLSDRLPFLLSYNLFGLDAKPLRIAIFVVHCANLVLFARLVYQWTTSRPAALIAALCWALHSSLAQPLTWSSAMNQIFWPTCLFAALSFRHAGCRTGEWLCFLTGFGVLELNVVYPALAFLRYPDRWRSTLPLFAVSAVYALANRWLAGPNTNAVYAINASPLSILHTLGQYVLMSMGSYIPWSITPLSPYLLAATLFALAALALSLLLDRDRLLAYGCAWFVICLGPVLLLPNHLTDYYLVVPSAGLALAFGVAAARRPLLLALPLVAYGAGSYLLSREILTYNRKQAEAARVLVRGVEQAVALHPGKTILLAGITTDQFWNIILDNPFRLIPGANVYLVPGSEKNIDPHPEYGDPLRYVLPRPEARGALTSGQALVYAAGGRPLRNVTGYYREIATLEWARELAPVLDLGQSFLAAQVGRGWEPIEHGFRWMQPRAEVTLGGPGKTLFVECFRSASEPRPGPVNLTIRHHGQLLGTLSLPQARCQGELLLPEALHAAPELPLELTVSPSFRQPPDRRELGLAFGRIGRK
jgi:hypothetical protein